MILCVFCLHDRIAQAFGRPFVLTHAGVAIRNFSDQVNKAPSQPDMISDLYHHAEDFDLYELGTWDDSTAEYELFKSPKLLVAGKQVKNGPDGKPSLVKSA